MSLGKNAENWRKYKVSKEETKNEVSEARARTFVWFQVPKMEKIICRLAKCRETRTRDLNLVKCIKNGEVNFLVTEEDIRETAAI